MHYLFRRQLAGERIRSLSPDQTNYSDFQIERARLAAELKAKQTMASPKPKNHKSRKYKKEAAEPPTPPPSPTNIRPPRTKKRARKPKNAKNPGSDSVSELPIVEAMPGAHLPVKSDSDADIEFGYESDAGYYSDVTIRPVVRD